MIYIFDKNDQFIQSYTDYEENTYKRVLPNGEWTFVFETPINYLFEKGNKVGLYDKDDNFRLFVIDSIEEDDEIDQAQVTCLNDYLTLDNTYIEDKRIRNGTCQEALIKLLEGSDYSPGYIEVEGNHNINYYFTSRLSGLNEILKLWHGELDTRIEKDGNNIVKKYIDIKLRIGKETNLRCTYDTNLTSLKRIILEDKFYNTIYGFGKALETEGGGYSRKLTFDDVEWRTPNNPLTKPLGQKFIQDSESVKKWGVHTGEYHNDKIEVQSELLEATYKALLKNLNPKIMYKSTIKDIREIEGFEHYQFSNGDTIYILNEDKDLTITARITEESYNIKNTDEINIVLGDHYLSLTDDDENINIKDVVDSIIKDTQINVNDTNFPNTLPSIPTVAAIGGLDTIGVNWSIEAKTYYTYEVYASKTKGFNPTFNQLVFKGQASRYIHECKPKETWYFRVRCVNSHGYTTDFSTEVEASTMKIKDGTTWIENGAIGDALIGTLRADRAWIGKIQAQYINLLEIKVGDENNPTFHIDSYARLYGNFESLSIQSNSVATDETVVNKMNNAITQSVSYTNSQIQLVNNEIQLKASKDSVTAINTKFENMEFNVRNLALNTNRYITEGSFTDMKIEQEPFKRSPGKNVILSLDVELDNVVATGSERRRVGAEFYIEYMDDSIVYYGCWIPLSSNPKSINERISTGGAILEKPIKSISSLGMYIQGVTGGTVRIGRPKVEIGTKPTGYSTNEKDIDKIIEGIDIGVRNLLRDSKKERTTTRFLEIYVRDILETHIGKEICVSFDCKINEGGTSRPLKLYPYQHNGISIEDKYYFTPTSNYKRFSFKTRVIDWGLNNTNYSRGSIGFYDDEGDNNYTVKNIKIELGNKPTGYTESPEDTQQQIDDIGEEVKVTKKEMAQIKTKYNEINSSVESLETIEMESRKVQSFRYIRDYLCGSSENGGNHLVELQIWANNINIAQGKTLSCSTNASHIHVGTNGEYSDPGQYVTFGSDTWEYLELDLEAVIHNIDMVKVWHYYEDRRKYNHKLAVSADGVNWHFLFNSTRQGTYTENPEGRTYIINESNTETRLTIAEEKITKDAIINVVKESKTNGIDTFVTGTKFEQTKDDFLYKFENSGKPNELINSNFTEGDRGWHFEATEADVFVEYSPSYNGNENPGCYSLYLGLWTGNGVGFARQIFKPRNRRLQVFTVGGMYHYTNVRVEREEPYPLAYIYLVIVNKDGSREYYNQDDVMRNHTNIGWDTHQRTFYRPEAKEIDWIEYYVFKRSTSGQFRITNLDFHEGHEHRKWRPSGEIYSNTTKIDGEGIEIIHNNGAKSRFSHEKIEFTASNGNATLRIKDGGLNMFTATNNEMCGFVKPSQIKQDWYNGVSISTYASGDYITLGHSTSADETTWSSLPSILIAKHDNFDQGNYWEGTNFVNQKVLLRTRTHLKNILDIDPVGRIELYANSNTPHLIYNSTDNKLCFMGDNELILGIREGEFNRTILKIIESPYERIQNYHHWNFNNWTMWNMQTAHTLSAQSKQLRAKTKDINDIYGVYSMTDGEIRYTCRETQSIGNTGVNLESRTIQEDRTLLIELPQILAENIESAYHINISKISWGDYRIVEKTPYYFVIESNVDNFQFTYEIVGKQLFNKTRNAIIASNQYGYSDAPEDVEDAKVVFEEDNGQIGENTYWRLYMKDK